MSKKATEGHREKRQTDAEGHPEARSVVLCRVRRGERSGEGMQKEEGDCGGWMLGEY